MQLLNFIKFIIVSYPATGYVVFEQTVVAFCVHGSYSYISIKIIYEEMNYSMSYYSDMH